MRLCLATIIVLAAAAACVDKGPGDQGPKIDPAYIQANLLAAPPTSMSQRLDAELRGADGKVKVRYLGIDLPPGAVIPGDKVTVVHYWQVVEPPGAAWRVFAHLRGDGNEFMNVDLTDMRTGHGPATWKAGEIIRDEQIFVLRKDWRSPVVQVVVGMYPKGGHKIEDRLDVVAPGATIVDRALQVAQLRVDLAKAPPPPGTLILPHASGPITIDGKADEPAWRTAAAQPSFSSADGCPELKDATEGKMLWDEQFLYVFVSANDADVWSPFTQHDDHLWEHDVVEVFIDADGNQRGYVELQVNPRNAHFDTWFAGTRGGPPRDDSFDAALTTQVLIKGTLDQRDDGDAGWDVELAIPWAAVKGKDAAMKFAVPPAVGAKLRLNVVRVDVTGADGAKRTFAASWNRITCDDFHALGRMLDAQLADAAGSVEPPPPPAPAPAAASDGDAGVPEAVPGAVLAPAPGATPGTAASAPRVAPARPTVGPRVQVPKPAKPE